MAFPEVSPVSLGSVVPDASVASNALTVPTLFAAPLSGLQAGREVTLSREEAGHARSLRVASGMEVVLTDGLGHRWLARLQSLDREAAVCRLSRELIVSPALPVRLAFGVGNKDRTLWLVEKAVELGASVLEPIEFARSASVADAARSPGFWRRAERRAIAALKQSGRSWLPRIRPVMPLTEWLRGLPEPGGLHLFADEAAERGLGAHLNGWNGRSAAVVLIGPEGGVEPWECESCRVAGFLAGCLGEHTLRFETAAVAALALLAERATRRIRPREAPGPPNGGAGATDWAEDSGGQA